MGRTIRNDEATTSDSFGRKRYIDALEDLIRISETPVVIGVYGTWGSGKTSFLKQLQAKLDPGSSPTTVWFDSWLHQFDEHPILAMVQRFIQTFNLQSKAKDLFGLALLTVSAFGAKQLAGLGPRDIKTLAEAYQEEHFQIVEARSRLRQRFKELVQTVTKDGTYKLVFFIDDLDRCSPDNQIKILEALKLYLNVSNCVYVLGVDREALYRSLQHHYGTESQDHWSANYLDKIVQVPFFLPQIESEEVLKEYFNHLELDLKLPDSHEVFRPMLHRAFHGNPRQLKRFANTLTIQAEMASRILQETYKPKILAFLVLVQYLAPTDYQLVSLGLRPWSALLEDERLGKLHEDLFGNKDEPSSLKEHLLLTMGQPSSLNQPLLYSDALKLLDSLAQQPLGPLERRDALAKSSPDLSKVAADIIEDYQEKGLSSEATYQISRKLLDALENFGSEALRTRHSE